MATIATLTILVSGSLFTMFQSGEAKDKLDDDEWNSYRIIVDGTTVTVKYPDVGRSEETSSNVSDLINSVLQEATEGGTKRAAVLIEGSGFLNSPISVPSNLKLVIEATLTLADNVNKHMIWMDRVDSVEIDGGVLNGNRENQAKDRSALSGILVRSSTNFSIRNMTIINCFHQGIDIVGLSPTDYSHDFVLEGNTCNKNGFDGIYIGYWARDGIIRHNTCNGNGLNNRATDHTGIDIGDWATNITVSENVCIDNWYNGIRVSNPRGHIIDTSCTIVNNYVSRNGYGDIMVEYVENNVIMSNTCVGDGVSRSGIILFQAARTVVVDNIITGSNWNSIYIDGTEDFQICNNSIDVYLGTGILSINDEGLPNARISIIHDNTITNAKLNGIFASNLGNCSIEGNTIVSDAMLNGITLKRCSFIDVVGNKVEGAKDNGVELERCSHLFVEGNHIEDSGANGILAGWVSHSRIVRNDIASSSASSPGTSCDILLVGDEQSPCVSVVISSNKCHSGAVKWGICEEWGQEVVISHNELSGTSGRGVQASEGTILSGNTVS